MAIITQLPGVEVAITVNGTQLQEHRDNEADEEPRTVTYYIEAESNQIFAVRIKVPRGYKMKGDSMSFEVCIDGKRRDWPLIEAKTVLWSDKIRTVEGCDLADGKIAKFRFNGLETANDGVQFNGEGLRVRDLGNIAVKINHTRLLRKTTFDPPTPDALADIGIVSEKAIAGQSTSHSVSLTKPMPSSNGVPAVWETENVDPYWMQPAATFVFRYRSKQALQSMLIVSRTPTPPPLEDRDPTTLTVDELRELQKRAKAARKQREDLIRIKREKHSKTPRPRKRARPNANATQLILGDNGGFRESSVSTMANSEANTPVTLSSDEEED